MKEIVRSVYYCDFCKHHSLTKDSITIHEKKCTLNPARVCTAIYCTGGVGAQDDLIDYLIDNSTAGNIDGSYRSPREETIEYVRDRLDGCPVCTISIMIERADRIVAHNIDFDLNIVQTNLTRSAALIAQKEHYCTMLKTMNMLRIPGRMGSYKWPKLIESYRYFFGKDFDGAHDAMVDVRACRDVYVALQEKLDELRGGRVEA